MSKLLRIDASSRVEASHSRKLADHFVEHWLKANPDGEVVVRDLAQNPLPHIADSTITGFYTPRAEQDKALRKATSLSDELITELTESDVLLIDTPMYNFSVPSALKAWIDQIVRINETFSFSPDTGFAGLLQGKRAFVITATGAVFSNDGMKQLDFLTPYLGTLLGFIGISTVEFIPLQGTTTDELAYEQSKRTAHEQIANLEVRL